MGETYLFFTCGKSMSSAVLRCSELSSSAQPLSSAHLRNIVAILRSLPIPFSLGLNDECEHFFIEMVYGQLALRNLFLLCFIYFKKWVHPYANSTRRDSEEQRRI